MIQRIQTVYFILIMLLLSSLLSGVEIFGFPTAKNYLSYSVYGLQQFKTESGSTTGKVEKKLLGRKIDAAISGIEMLVNRKLSGKAPPALARVSQTLATARTSISPLDRPSPTPVPENTIKDIKKATEEVQEFIDEDDRRELNAQIGEVERVAGNLQRVSAVIKEEEAKKK